MDEKELVQRAKIGDKEALSELIEIYYDEVYSFLYRRMGNKAAAEDVTQDTFIKFIKNLPYYKEKNKLKSFLFTIAINTSNDFFRRHKQETSLHSLDNVGEEITEDETLQKEKALIVRQAVLSLPEVQRDVIILRFYHDLKIKEIASVQKVPIPTVKTRLRRALKALKECELW
ncbi:MAG: RNA polymerase sigma factor [Clostridia bacterium]|nr:RNA polymerase sigma factor [Clostridia bacterium]